MNIMKKVIKKRVNVTASAPIRVLSIPIRGTSKGLLLSTEDIVKIICQKAVVDEVLEDGTLVRLDLSNYNKDNSKPKEKAEEQIPIIKNVTLNVIGSELKTEFAKEEVIEQEEVKVTEETKEEEVKVTEEKKEKYKSTKGKKEKEVKEEDEVKEDFEVTEDDEEFDKINKSIGLNN